MELTGSVIPEVVDLFCPKCGDIISWTVPVVDSEKGECYCYPLCKACHIPMEKRVPYLIPLVNDEGHVINIPPNEVASRLGPYDGGCWRLLGDNEDAINVFVNGELNGIDTGKKIREKNEQLKKKVAGYENEQRNLRAETERNIAKKHAEHHIDL